MNPVPPALDPRACCSGLVLAGGRGSRLGGVDKGLVELRGRPLAALACEALEPQVARVMISANRNREQYEALGKGVLTDEFPEFQGPLAGMLAGLRHCDSEWLLCLPCDMPQVPPDLAARLLGTAIAQGRHAAYASFGGIASYVCVLLHRSLAESLAGFLSGEQRAVRKWLASVDACAIEFEAPFRAPININTPDDLHKAQQPDVLIDRLGRRKRKLRLSLTDRCNFRCRYCMPEQPQWMPKKELLNRNELVALAKLFVTSGIEEIRITGGEPLLRKDAAECIAALNQLRPLGLRRLSLTTNASYLASKIIELRAAGLDDINISLDALDPARFMAMRGHRIEPVLEGIAAAQASGIPFKLNTVLIQGQNDSEILPLVRWARQHGIPLRFIEYMPLDAPHNWSREQVVDEARIIDVLRSEFEVTPLPRDGSPASYYSLDGGHRVGVVSTVSNPFCSTCDRLRLTARGELYTCLFSQTGTPLTAMLRENADPAQLIERVRRAVWHKDAGYAANPQPVERPILMHALGG